MLANSDLGPSSDDGDSPTSTFKPDLYQQQQHENADTDAYASSRERQPSWTTSQRESLTAAERARRNLNAKLANPLAGLSHAALMKRGGRYARQHHMGDEEDIRAFELGAVLAQDPERYENVEGLTPDELDVLRNEFTNKWSQPRLMYLVIVLCSACAAVQGMGMTFPIDWLID